MKKKIYNIVMISVFAIGACLFFANSIQNANALEKKVKYFNPEIPAPYSPCDTGGNSICVDWD